MKSEYIRTPGLYRVNGDYEFAERGLDPEYSVKYYPIQYSAGCMEIWYDEGNAAAEMEEYYTSAHTEFKLPKEMLINGKK